MSEPERDYQRELAMIYAIDTLRDQTRSPESFLNGCASIIRDQLNPQLLQIVTLDSDDCPAQHITRQSWQPSDGSALMRALSQALSSGISSDLAMADGQVLVRALLIGDERLGVLVLGCEGRPWSSIEQQIIAALVSQIDSAFDLLRTLRRLEHRNRELETIYHLDRLIDSTPDFEVALGEALRLMAQSINARWSFIMLYGPDERELELRAVSDQLLVDPQEPLNSTLRTLARATIKAGKLLRREGIDQYVGSYIGVPLILQNQILGVFAGANPPGQRGFGSEQVTMLRAITSQMDTALFEDREQRHIRTTFARYVSPAVVDLMLHTQGHDFLQVHRQELTMLFSDIRGFTSACEVLPEAVVVTLLNEHLAAMTTIIRNAGGTVDKFVGDEVVAFFGAPLARADHALLAVRTALEMQHQHQRLMARWEGAGLPHLPIGIGIGTGEGIVGNIGSTLMMNYTAIGPTINLAARLCSAAGGDEILINAAAYAAVGDSIVATPVAPLNLRHIAQPVQAYSVQLNQEVQ